MKEYKFKINGKDYAVKIGEASGRSLTVNVNGADYEVELENELAAAGDTSAGAGEHGIRSFPGTDMPWKAFPKRGLASPPSSRYT